MIAGVIVANARTGSSGRTSGPDLTEHEVRRQRLTVRDSAFIGQTVHGERRRRAGGNPATGPTVASASPPSNAAPSAAAPAWRLRAESPTGSYPTAFETRVTRVGFYGYGGAGCEGMLDRAADGRRDEFLRCNLAHLLLAESGRGVAQRRVPRPLQRSWIKPGKCGVMVVRSKARVAGPSRLARRSSRASR